MSEAAFFPGVFFEDEGHPVDARQGLRKLRNNRSAKSRKDLTTQADSLSFLSHSSTDFLYSGQSGSKSRSGFSNFSFS